MRTLALVVLLSLAHNVSAWGQTQFDIPVANVPERVHHVLTQYLHALQLQDETESANAATALMGGSLLNPDGQTMSEATRRYGFKKDRQNVRFYAVPPVLTRCQRFDNESEGYAGTAIRGTRYKIWIAKQPGQPGLPAPVNIMVATDGRVFVCSSVGNL
jgi:hypothetical protein